MKVFGNSLEIFIQTDTARVGVLFSFLSFVYNDKLIFVSGLEHLSTRGSVYGAGAGERTLL